MPLRTPTFSIYYVLHLLITYSTFSIHYVLHPSDYVLHFSFEVIFFCKK
eukprot:UN22607